MICRKCIFLRGPRKANAALFHNTTSLSGSSAPRWIRDYEFPQGTKRTMSKIVQIALRFSQNKEQISSFAHFVISCMCIFLYGPCKGKQQSRAKIAFWEVIHDETTNQQYQTSTWIQKQNKHNQTRKHEPLHTHARTYTYACTYPINIIITNTYKQKHKQKQKRKHRQLH